MTKSVRQHKIVKDGKLQKSESSLICVVIAEGSTNAHEIDRYRWNIFGLCEMRWKNFCETATEEGHKVFFSEKED